DPGTPGAPFGVISWEKTGVTAIHLTKSGDPQWTTTPLDAPEVAQLQRKADLKVDGDTLKGIVTVTFTGQEALVRRLRGEDEATRKKSLEDEVKTWLRSGAVVKTKSMTGLGTFDDSVVAVFDVELPNLVSQAGVRTLIPLSIFTVESKNPF